MKLGFALQLVTARRYVGLFWEDPSMSRLR